MSNLKDIKCIRCERTLVNTNIFEGCPYCYKEGFNVNYTTSYNYAEINAQINLRTNKNKRGLWKYKKLLPINQETNPVTLKEGDTPLIHLKKLGNIIGLKNLYIKDETRNPTWSYKDRLCSVAITRAIEEKAKVVTISSTGNHGASAAAYAAAAGIPCVIFTVPEVPETMKTLMQSYGAYVIAVPEAEDRWMIMKECVERFGWFPISGYVSPPIGSNPFGVDGYKTIAYEIYEELKEIPKFVSIPTAYGDGLYGTWKGFLDLYKLRISSELPRMVASEVFGSLKETLKSSARKPISVSSSSSVSFSISNDIGTYQALQTIIDSKGLAEVSNDSETIEMQKLLASTEGIYGEASSLTSLVALNKLYKLGKIQSEDLIVSVITSTGLKDTESTAEYLPNVKLIEPTVEDLKSVLKNEYNFII